MYCVTRISFLTSNIYVTRISIMNWGILCYKNIHSALYYAVLLEYHFFRGLHWVSGICILPRRRQIYLVAWYSGKINKMKRSFDCCMEFWIYNILTNRSYICRKQERNDISFIDNLLWNNVFFLKFIVWSAIFNQFALGLDNLSNFLKYHLKDLQIFVLFDYNNTTLMAFTSNKWNKVK